MQESDKSGYFMVSFNNQASPIALDETRLDNLDRAIVTALIRQPEAPFSAIAEETQVSARTVARRFEVLRRRGVIRVVGRTLPSFGGRLAWLFRISGSPQKLDALALKLQRLDTTRWLRYSLDRGELLCGSVTAGFDHNDLLHGLYSTVPARDVQVHQLLHVWSDEGVVTSSHDGLDELDQLVLEAYAKDGRISATDLAQQLRVDPATVSRHRRKLIEAGILFFETNVHPSFLNAFGDFNLWLSVHPGAIQQLGRLLYSLPQTRFVGATSGSCQLYANIVVQESADVMTFLDELVNSPTARDMGIDAGNITAVETIPMGQVIHLSAS